MSIASTTSRRVKEGGGGGASGNGDTTYCVSTRHRMTSDPVTTASSSSRVRTKHAATTDAAEVRRSRVRANACYSLFVSCPAAATMLSSGGRLARVVRAAASTSAGNTSGLLVD